MKVPWSSCDIGPEERFAAEQVLKSGWVSRGKITGQFEAALGDYLHSKVTTMASGSSALLVALRAAGVRAGDTVIVPDFTYIVTASIPALLGCRVIPVDIDYETFNIEAEAAEKAIKKYHAKAVVVTDIAGLPCWVPDIKNCVTIVDACEAFGAERGGLKEGSFEYLSVFSFETTKLITTIQGGAISSTDEALVKRCALIADYGGSDFGNYVFNEVGMGLRIDDARSAIGLCQLNKVSKYLEWRRLIAHNYRMRLKKLRFQKVPWGMKSANWMAVATLDDRDEMLAHLRSDEIDARPPFMSVYNQPWFPTMNGLELHNSWLLRAKGIMLPIFNNMTEEQVDYVIGAAQEI